MIKVLSADQQRELDNITIEKEPIAGIDLMERAAERCTAALIEYLQIYERIGRYIHIGIVCGTGNNGGDGLVMARLLHQAGYRVTCFCVALSEKGSEAFEQNKLRLSKTSVECVEFNEDSNYTLDDYGITDLIDALFGTGLTRPAEGLAAKSINFINSAAFPVFSIDVPSGLFCDQANGKADSIVKADVILTIHAPKLSFLFAENQQYVGAFQTIDIGLDVNYTETITATAEILEKSDLSARKKYRPRFSHKGTYGHAGIVAGSEEKMGAALLATEAALRVGTGLVTAFIPRSGNVALNTRIPCAMLSYTGVGFLESIPFSSSITYGVGPGIGTHEETKSAFKTFLEHINEPIVVDADGLNILSTQKKWLSLLPDNSILTPHPKEFERLCGSYANGFERLDKQRNFAQENNIFVVVKDAYSSIACPDGRIYFNTFGSSGMATGGSGDVLTGMITGFLASGYSPEDAAILGVGLHGIAGKKCAKELGEEYMNAEDLIQFIRHAFTEIR